MTSISVILPAFNEEQGVAAVIDAIHTHHLSAEIIVVDDGSSDATAEIATRCGARVLRHPANAGYGASLKDGIRVATHDIIVIIDADGSYPVHRIADLVQKIDDGFDMAVGSRQGLNQYDSVLKIPARFFFRFLVEFTTGSRIPDVNSGLRAFRKSQVLSYFPDLCQSFSFTTTLTLIYKLTGKFVCYIPIEYKRRIGLSKVNILHDSLRTLQYIVEVIVRYNPLKLFLLIVGALDFLALAALSALLFFPSAYLVLLASLLFVGSIFVFCMGLLAFLLKER